MGMLVVRRLKARVLTQVSFLYLRHIDRLLVWVGVNFFYSQKEVGGGLGYNQKHRHMSCMRVFLSYSLSQLFLARWHLTASNNVCVVCVVGFCFSIIPRTASAKEIRFSEGGNDIVCWMCVRSANIIGLSILVNV